LRRANPERLAARREAAFGPCSRMARTLPCCSCGAPPPSDPDHVRTRGAGGRDAGNVVPLCRRCHQQRHALGVLRWQLERRVSLAEEAARVARLVASHACEDYPETPRTRDGRAVMGTRCAICLRAIEEPTT
jgi:hypothetical protein